MTALVLILNEQGIPQRWANWMESVCYKAKDLVVWELGDSDWTKLGGINRVSGNQSSITFSSIMAVRGAFLPKRRVPVLTNRNLFRRDLCLCGYCGRTFKETQLTRDHIVPISRGGEDTWTNCIASCKRCNNYKDDYLLEERGMELLYVPYTPTREESMILSNRNILACQMEFLKQSIPLHSRVHKM